MYDGRGQFAGYGASLTAPLTGTAEQRPAWTTTPSLPLLEETLGWPIPRSARRILRVANPRRCGCPPTGTRPRRCPTARPTPTTAP